MGNNCCTDNPKITDQEMAKQLAEKGIAPNGIKVSARDTQLVMQEGKQVRIPKLNLNQANANLGS